MRLGTLGFGGPIALADHMQRDLVERRKWISQEDFPVQKKVHSLAVDVETHLVYAPEQEENSTPVARMIVYDALPAPKVAPAK